MVKFFTTESELKIQPEFHGLNCRLFSTGVILNLDLIQLPVEICFYGQILQTLMVMEMLRTNRMEVRLIFGETSQVVIVTQEMEMARVFRLIVGII